MVHPVHGTDPDKAKHRTYKTLNRPGDRGGAASRGYGEDSVLHLQRRR